MLKSEIVEAWCPIYAPIMDDNNDSGHPNDSNGKVH